MAAADQSALVGLADRSTISHMFPLTLVRQMTRTGGSNEVESAQQDIADAYDEMDTYRGLTELQKENLKDMIRFSPDPLYTSWRILEAADNGQIVGAYFRWNAGFQYFIDGRSGEGNDDNECINDVAAHQGLGAARHPSALGPGQSAHSHSSAPAQPSASGMPARTGGTRGFRDTGSQKAHPQRGVLKVAAEIDALRGSLTGDDDHGLGGPSETIDPDSQGKESPKLGAKRSAADSILPPTKKRRITERSCRGPKFAQRLKRRSGNKCELSGRTQDTGLVTEGAHIFTIQTSAGERAKDFWNLLYMFWNPLIVRKLRAACTRHINDMSNGITMDISTHRLYDELHFYLEVLPGSYEVSGDKAQYTVKIRFPKSPITLYNHWKGTVHLQDGRPGIVHFRDGDEITFKTNDQKNCPLPDPVLLQVRAIMTKCAFVRGGADREDEVLANEMRGDQIRAEQKAASIDNCHYSYSDDSLNDEEGLCARDREDEILEIELRNEQIRAAQKAALIGNAHYPYSDEDFNEEEELSDRNREDEIFDDALRNEQIRAAQKAALIDDAHDTYSDAYLNEEEEMYDRNREDEIFEDERHNEQIRAAQQAALIDDAHDTYSDAYLNEEDEIHDPPGVINVDTDDAIPGDTDWNARLESWLEHTPPVDRGLLDGEEDDTPGEDGQHGSLHASGIWR